MKTIILTLAIGLLTTLLTAQSEPVALKYSIGAFKIPSSLDQQIGKRFNQLDRNKTYTVTIVGSADFLGSEDNNQVLSNKRVKFAEYHLLKKYRDLRLIIKLDSKGELLAHKAQTKAGIQEHRMVYIYVDEYRKGYAGPGNTNSSTNAAPNDGFANRVVATSAAAQAEHLKDVPVSVAPNQKKINPISETAQIEIEKQKQAAILAQLNAPEPTVKGLPLATASIGNSNTEPTASGSNLSGQLKVKEKPEPRKFDEEGTFGVGEKLLLSDLNFRPGSHYLRPSSIPSLRKLINVMEANPTLRIEIIGHICCHPDYSPHPDGFDREAGNHKLSFNRANNIKEYLEKNGIEGSRINATGMGAKERLVYPEETDQDRIKNRRVEIKILAL